MSTPQQRIERGDALYRLLSRLPGEDFGASPACREVDPELFFPGFGADLRRVRQAKQICAGCPLRKPCLDAALRNKESGIWGGTSAVERRRMRAAAADEQEAA